MTMSCSETVSSANRNKRHFTVYIESEHILRMCAKKLKISTRPSLSPTFLSTFQILMFTIQLRNIIELLSITCYQKIISLRLFLCVNQQVSNFNRNAIKYFPTHNIYTVDNLLENARNERQITQTVIFT